MGLDPVGGEQVNLNPKPSEQVNLNPKPEALNPKPHTLTPKPGELSIPCLKPAEPGNVDAIIPPR